MRIGEGGGDELGGGGSSDVLVAPELRLLELHRLACVRGMQRGGGGGGGGGGSSSACPDGSTGRTLACS